MKCQCRLSTVQVVTSKEPGTVMCISEYQQGKGGAVAMHVNRHRIQSCEVQHSVLSTSMRT